MRSVEAKLAFYVRVTIQVADDLGVEETQGHLREAAMYQSITDGPYIRWCSEPGVIDSDD